MLGKKKSKNISMINQTVCVVSDFTEGEQKDINNYRHIQLHLLYKDKTVCVTDQNLIFIFR